ncbi:hypothetical protein ASPFODRAFT_39163, partial [Aspergillus luchuensis CBS 106.47]
MQARVLVYYFTSIIVYLSLGINSRTPSGYEKEDCGRLRTKRGKYLMTADSDPHI